MIINKLKTSQKDWKPTKDKNQIIDVDRREPAENVQSDKL